MFFNDDIGAGVAACYRGYRLYDTNETKALVTKWVSFYKKYRSILIRDIIHVRKTVVICIEFFSYHLFNRFVELICNLLIVICMLIHIQMILKVIFFFMLVKFEHI